MNNSNKKNMKFIKLLTLIFFCTNVYSQDTIRVSYGKTTTRWFTVPEKGIQMNLKRSNYATISNITVEVKLQSNSEVYKKNIELNGDNANFTTSASEFKKSGRYYFNLVPVKKKLLKQKIIKVYLQQNPANSMMMMPSKSTLLAEISFK